MIEIEIVTFQERQVLEAQQERAEAVAARFQINISNFRWKKHEKT